ncbi:MAG TPA: type II secretion system protein GspD [Phycisphaerales bacterium]|nr:type II secretion system protein GspD [Phycisphaerales bacterium]
MNAQPHGQFQVMTRTSPQAVLALWMAILAVGLSPLAAQQAATEPAATEPQAVEVAELSPETPEPAPEPALEPAPEPVAGEPMTEPTSEPAATQPAGEPAVSTMPESAPASQPAAVPGAPISLNFRDASLRTVLEYLSEVAGLVVVEEARVEGRVTVLSRQSITAEEAVALLDTVLKQKGYAAIRIGRTLKIVTLEQAKKELIPVRSGNDPEKITPGDSMVTQIIPIRNADAVKLKADLASLIPSTADVASNASSNTLIITGTESTVRRIVEIIRAIDVHMSEVSQVKVFQLKYANASSAAKLITDIFKEEQTTQQTSGFPFGGRRAFMMPGMPGGGQSSDSEKGQRGIKVTASADDRTNTLVVSAATDMMKVIEGVVKELDANPAEEQAVFIYRLKNAQAKNLETVLNNIFGASTSSTGTSASRQTSSRQTTGTTSAFGSRTSGTSSRGLSSGTTGGSTRGSTRGSTSGTQGRTFGGTSGTFGRMSAATAAAASDLAGQVYVVADEDTNALLVTTASKNFERVKAIIADLDRAVPQVLIKVLIAEVSHDKSLDLGVEFSGMNLYASGSGIKAGTDFSVAAQSGGFMFTMNEHNVAAAIRAIAGIAKLDVLSRPYILASDNQEASIMIGKEVPFITNTRTTDTGQTINTIEYDDIGIILTVTPHINPQGLVTLDVYPEISTLTGETIPISETVNAPVFAKRSAESRVAIRDGQTIVIGGLMEDRNTKSVDKVPVLGDIPGLGLLFQRTVDKKTKTELLIFLTPHVAQQPEELKDMSEAEKAGTKAVRDAVEPGAFEEHLRGMNRGAASQPAKQETEPVTVIRAGTTQPAAGANDEPKP